MKQMTHTSLLRRLSALVVAAALALPTVYASAGEKKLQTVRTLTDGLDYVNTVTYHPAGGRVESFALELGADSEAYPIMVQGSGSIYSAASIGKAVEYAQSLGYHVLGAINTDFFSMTTGVPMGVVIEDGVYKSSPENETVMAVTDGQFDLLAPPVITMTLTNQESGQQVSLTHLNKWRTAAGGLYLLNEHFSTVSTRTSTSGWMVRMEETDAEELSVSGELTLRVTELLQTSEAVPIGEGNYILTADELSGLEDVFQSFQEGDLVTLTTQCGTPELEQADWACGVGDVMIRDGMVTDSSQWTYIKDGRNPRTALGVREDGSALLYVVDGRRSGYSGGLSQTDLAQELLEQGCEWAVNLDGGGSSAMSVWVPGQDGPAIVNLPSDGKARSCATYLLLVTDDSGDGRPDRLALKNDGLVVLAGTSVDLGEAVVLDSGLNPLSRSTKDVTIQSEKDLGELDGTVYTAGDRAGTDILLLQSDKLGVEGSAQLHVVTALSDLTVTRSDSGQAVTALSMKPGQQVELDATGQYWSRAAMRDQSAVTWDVQGDVGVIDENGVFTASSSGSLSGSITATAGGVTKTIPVTLTNIHTDVDEDHWAYTAVEYCYENQLVGGVTATQFGPDQNIRRGDFLLMLYRAAGSPAVASTVDLPDVSPSDYYATAIFWALENKLASGMEDGSFAPGINITREQAFTILNRALPLLGIYCESAPVSILDQFSDKDELASWAAEHSATLIAYQIVGGSDGRLNPRGNLSRAEMAALLYKLGHYDSSSVTPILPEAPVSSDVTGLTLSHSDVTLQPGEQLQLSADLSPEGAVGSVTWSTTSSLPGMASVSSGGLVTNLNASRDTLILTITASCGGFQASCTVRCLPAQQSGVVSQGAATLNVRSGPGTEYEILDRISEGLPVIILDQLDNGWLRIQYRASSGAAAEGYVSAAYITLN